MTVLGAGAVGLTVGARLARAGHPVLFVTRRPEAANAIARNGVRLGDPASGESFCVRTGVVAVCGADQARSQIGDGPVLVCVRASDTLRSAAELSRAVPRAVVASLQNDVGNAAELATRFTHVIGGVYRQTCTRTSDACAVALGAGRIVIGAFQPGLAPETERLASVLRSAGYDVGVSPRIAADQWLKLAINLMSAPNALVVRDDHATPAFVDLKVRLLEEARAVFAAAGIEAYSCDGRDRSLDEEIEFQRSALAQGTSARRLPVYNQVWSALRHGGPLEADAYHRRIIDLATRHEVRATQNARLLDAVCEAYATGRGPECLRAMDLLVA